MVDQTRASQVYLESIIAATAADPRVSQVYLENIIAPTAGNPRISQLYLENIKSFGAPRVLAAGQRLATVVAGAGIGAAPPLFTPEQITTLGWYDLSNSDFYTEDVGIDQATDRSGNGNHVTQATGGSQPLVAAASIGGLSAADFISTDFWERSGISGFPADSGSPVMMAHVSRTASTASGSIFDFSDAALTNRTALFLWSSNQALLRTSGTSAATQAFTDTTDAHVWSGRCQNSNRRIWLDGVEGTPNTATGSNLNYTNMRVGLLFQNVLALVGQIGEIVFWENTSDSIRQMVEGYLAWKWSLVDGLAMSHPYKNAPP